MKIHFFIIFLNVVALAHGQGTFVYDQQSADESNQSGEGGGGTIQSNEPFGQSFTPTLTSVGFIRLWLADENLGNNLGATVSVNLLADSITGEVLAESLPVSLPDGFGDGTGSDRNGYANFFFSTPATVAPGTTYFFQVVVQSGDTMYAYGDGYGYAGGTEFLQGTAVNSEDLWFREGIVTPEPSVSWLILFGSGVLLYARRKFIS
jgi:hypothetical protein